VFAAFRIALPVAIVVVVLTEMIGDSIGLGYYITIWSTRFSFSHVYAAIVTIGICGFALDQGLLLLRRRVVYWQREAG
jgi:NitT/TauT family transport system permease protein